MRNLLQLPFTLLLIFLNSSALALAIDWHGNYRVRSEIFHQLDLNNDFFGNKRTVWDHLFTLEPSFILNDYISIHTQVDFLDNRIWGNDVVIGDVSSTPNFYQTDSNGGVPILYQDPFFTSIAYNHKINGQSGSTPVRVNLVWAEMLIPFGKLSIGRQPTHFGLGISEHDGRGLTTDFGAGQDRIFFESGLDDYVFAVGYEMDIESDTAAQANLTAQSATGIDTGADDLDRWIIKLGLDTELYKLLAQFSKRNQDAESFNTWDIDIYGQVNVGIFTIQSEFFTVQGDFGSRSIQSYNAVGRVEGALRWWDFGVESGFGSGTSNGPSNTTHMNTVAFHPDYNISYLLFEEALPGGAGFNAQDSTDTSIAETPRHAGAISNAIYGRAYTGATYKGIRVGTNIIAAFAHKDPLIGFNPDDTTQLSFTSKKYYGVEYSFIFSHDVSKLVQYSFVFAHFLPGSIFDAQQELLFSKPNGNNAESTWTIQTALNLSF